MKTAEQWQKELNLDALPDAEMLAMLNEVAGMEAAPLTADEALGIGLVTELDPDTLREQVESLYMAETIGAALSAARGARKLSVREAARRLGVTAPAVLKLERGENAETVTVARYAAALGYRARLTLEPDSEAGGAPVISTPLSSLRP